MTIDPRRHFKQTGHFDKFRIDPGDPMLGTVAQLWSKWGITPEQFSPLVNALLTRLVEMTDDGRNDPAMQREEFIAILRENGVPWERARVIAAATTEAVEKAAETMPESEAGDNEFLDPERWGFTHERLFAIEQWLDKMVEQGRVKEGDELARYYAIGQSPAGVAYLEKLMNAWASGDARLHPGDTPPSTEEAAASWSALAVTPADGTLPAHTPTQQASNALLAGPSGDPMHIQTVGIDPGASRATDDGQRRKVAAYAMQSDPRYYQQGPAGDLFRADASKAFKEAFGDAPAATSEPGLGI